MATVDPEKKLQSRVLHWLKDDLGYTYIGDLRDIDNTPIKEDLLSANLKKRGYTDDQIKTAIGELVNKAGNQVDSLYRSTAVSILCSVMGVKVQKMHMVIGQRFTISIG